MAFPLPVDPAFRREAVLAWLEDVEERLLTFTPGADESWRIAREIYLSLPPGEGDPKIETALFDLRVKLDNHT